MGAGSLAPCAFALNAGLGGDRREDGKEREETSPCPLQGLLQNLRAGGPGLVCGARGKTRLLGGGRSRAAAHFTGRMGPGSHEMTVFASSSFQPVERGTDSTERAALLGVFGEDNT